MQIKIQLSQEKGQKTLFSPKMTSPCPRNRLWIGLRDSHLGLQIYDFVCESQMQAHDPTHIPFHLCTHIWCFAQMWEKILLLLPACGGVLVGQGCFKLKNGNTQCIWGEVWQGWRNLLYEAQSKSIEKSRQKNPEEHDNYPVQVVKLFWFPWFEIIFLAD